MTVRDNGYIVMDVDRNEFYCGMKAFDTQIRKAQIFHNERYANDVIEKGSWKSEFKIGERNLAVKPITLTVEIN